MKKYSLQAEAFYYAREYAAGAIGINKKAPDRSRAFHRFRLGRKSYK